MGEAGHVFVVCARIEHLDHDVMVLPTDLNFSVSRTWMPALGVSDKSMQDDASAWRSAARRLTPDGWSARRWGRAREGAPGIPLLGPTWFVDSAAYGGSAGVSRCLDEMIDRVRAALGDVAAAGISAGSGRPRPLVAIPTIGVRGGGFASIRGSVIDRLLALCSDVVAQTDLDIAIVAAVRSDHAAFQAQRRKATPNPVAQLTAEQLDTARRVAARAQEGSLALFLGAGVSMSAGLPSWNGLIAELAADADVQFGQLTSPLDKAELLQRVLGPRLGEEIARIIRRTTRYGLTHALLASIEVEQAVTTNYDALYERAVADGGRDAIPVLPFDRTVPRSPWLLKMHGDAQHPRTIVLSRSDFVGYDSRSGPMGAMVQALLLTKHLFVVGSSMTDDNFLRLAHEVVAFTESAMSGVAAEPEGVLGTVLTLRADPAAERLWQGRFSYAALSPSDVDENPGVLARRVAIFLDTVVMYATPPAHLADPAYEMLLDLPSRTIARVARRLRDLIDSNPDDESWRRLRDALGGLGA